MRIIMFTALNLVLLLTAVALGMLGVIELFIDSGCYFYGEKTVFCFTPSLALLSLATLIGGFSLFLIWRRREKLNETPRKT